MKLHFSICGKHKKYNASNRLKNKCTIKVLFINKLKHDTSNSCLYLKLRIYATFKLTFHTNGIYYQYKIYIKFRY